MRRVSGFSHAVAGVAVALTLATAGCGGGSKPPAPAPASAVPTGDAFFDPPKTVTGAPGDVIRRRPSDAAGLGATASAQSVVMYQTTAPDGTPTAATGLVALPKGTPPAGGWPVVAFDHGTSGIAPPCGPSRATSTLLSGTADLFGTLLTDGYAVVQPDYEGIGVTGSQHPYLQGKPAADATIDLVRAARHLDPGVGTGYYVVGHSEGGHAAIWTADQAPAYAPDLTLKGVVPIAPGNGFQLMPALVASRSPTAAPYLNIFLLLVEGAAAGDPSVRPADVLTPAGLDTLRSLTKDCLAFAVTASPAADQIIRADADMGPLTKVLTRNSVQLARPSVPVFLPQGTADALAPLNRTLAATYCQEGIRVYYKTYPDLTHGPAETEGATPDIVAWIQDIEHGGAGRENCGAAGG